MKAQNITFLGSAAGLAQCPPPGPPEIAIVGRSNVGKSSLINKLLGRRALARVSATPGKTRLLNFFDVDGSYRLVDLPGYGFALVSKKEQESWAVFLEEYLLGRKTLAGVIQLIDVSIPPVRSDIEMRQWLRTSGIRTIPVFTKADKARQSDIARRVGELEPGLSGPAPVVLSARTGLGIEALRKQLRFFFI